MSDGNRAPENEAIGKRFSKIRLVPLKKPQEEQWGLPKRGDIRDQVIYGKSQRIKND